MRHAILRAATCALIGAFIVFVSAVPAFARPSFDPEYVLSDAKLRDVGSMTRAQVQSFLDAQPGSLKSFATTDHNGDTKRASDIIYEACTAWTISPKVMLALLQKENSLITNPSPTPRALSRAIGAGCPNSVDNRYPGFGNQIWNGARMLDGYGEGKSTSYIPVWSSPRAMKVAEGSVTPRNIATFKLYTYNPVIGAEQPYGDLTSQAGSLHGNANFWDIYWRYFGDPLGGASSAGSSTSAKRAPGSAPPVTRWKPASTSGGLSTAQIIDVLERRGKTHSIGAGANAPVYRFLLVKQHRYFYLESKNLRDWLLNPVNRDEVRPAGVILRAMR